MSNTHTKHSEVFSDAHRDGAGCLIPTRRLWNLPSLYGPVVATSLTPSQVADNDGDETADHRLSTVPRRVVSSQKPHRFCGYATISELSLLCEFLPISHHMNFYDTTE